MAPTNNNNGDFNLLLQQELAHQYYSSSSMLQVLYPYVQQQQQPKKTPQQVEWNSYLQQLQLQQWEELEQQIEMQREMMTWELELPRLVSFLKKDYSFFSQWNWNPNNKNNNAQPADSGQMMKFEPGSFFSEDNLIYSRERAKSGDISRTNAKLVSEDSSTDQKPLGGGVEQGSSGFDVKQVAGRNAKGKGVEDLDSDEYDVEQLTSGTVTKMGRCRKFERNAKKGKRAKCKR